MDELEYNLDRVKFLWDRKKLKLLLEKLHIYQFLKNFLFSSFIHLYHYSFRIHIPLYQNITYKILLNYKNIIQRSRYPEIVLTR